MEVYNLGIMWEDTVCLTVFYTHPEYGVQLPGMVVFYGSLSKVVLQESI